MITAWALPRQADLGRLGEHVGARAIASSAGLGRRRRSPAWARTAGSGATAAAPSGASRLSIAAAHATAVSSGVARAPDVEVRDQPQRRRVLDRLVRRPVLAEADRVVREDVDDALLHQRGHADRVAAVVAEGEEGAAVRDQAAVQRDAVHDRGHAELAHAVVDVAAAPAFGVRRDAPSASKRSGGVCAGVGEVRAGQVGAAAEQLGQRLR